jgi:hypothetical protein
MTTGVDLQGTITSLRRQAEALGELRRLCAQLRDARDRSNAQLDALAAAIDASIDACLLIGERAAMVDPRGQWKAAVTELERQLRSLGVLRSQVLALYGGVVVARCGT